jgi:hypothetical protein
MTESIIYMTPGVHPCINCNLYITRSACRSRLWNVSKDLLKVETLAEKILNTDQDKVEC